MFAGWSDGDKNPIRIVNINDDKSYRADFKPTGTANVQANAPLNIFPNPVKDELTIGGCLESHELH